MERTEATWNPSAGCTKVSPGCKKSNAETIAIFSKNGIPKKIHQQYLFESESSK